MCLQPPLSGKHFFQKLTQQGYDVNPWITVRFGTSTNHRILFLFQNTHHQNKSRKKISILGLSEFQWNEIEEKVQTGSGSFGLAYKAKFNGNTVVVKRLRSERPAEIAFCQRRKAAKQPSP